MTSQQDRPVGRRPMVAGDGVPQERLEALAVRGGFAVAAANGHAGRTGEAADVLVIDAMTTKRLEAVLSGGHRGFVEFRDDAEALGRRVATAGEADGLYLALTTPTAFSQVDVAKVMCDALALRGALPLHLRANVEMALHETVANGVLHGNLQTNIALKDETEFHAAFRDHLKQLLANPEVRRRWIEINAGWTEDGLTVSVDDEGEGYDLAVDPVAMQEAIAHGRGLAIVNALASDVTVSRGGQRTTLRFDYGR